MSHAHLDMQTPSVNSVPPLAEGLRLCGQWLAQFPSHCKTGIAGIVALLATAGIALFRRFPTHEVGGQRNGDTLERMGVRPSCLRPHYGRGFASCASVIAALLFGFNAHAAPLPTDNCLFNWAEGNYPSLFAPAGSPTTVGTVYTYRHYPATNAYLGVSSVDNNVYYLGPDGNMQNEGPLSDWLPKAGCPVPAPPQIDCLFNWAEGNYPSLFAPAGSPATVGSIYTYRYYSATKAYLGVSSTDNRVYYVGPDGKLQDEGPISVWLPMAGCQNAFAAPSYPVIFIHGLNSSALAWAEPGSSLKEFLVNNGGWTFGGSPTYDPNAKKVNGILGRGDFYTLTFYDNPNLGFDVQGGELSAIIQAVLSANPGMGKVILVAHSMGGLAAREYLQGLSREFDNLQVIPYRGDVDKLITVGTPHQGSYIVEICLQNTAVCKWLGYDPSGAVISELRPGSENLNTLKAYRRIRCQAQSLIFLF